MDQEKTIIKLSSEIDAINNQIEKKRDCLIMKNPFTNEWGVFFQDFARIPAGEATLKFFKKSTR